MPAFEQLLAEGGSVPLEGWDFSWFEGRATEERPRWGYSRLLGERMARAAAALDIQTGGGEVLAGIPHPPISGRGCTGASARVGHSFRMPSDS